MQEQAVEVSFCDLCGTSVPAGDLEAGKAVRHQGKTIGVCCLAVLRGPVGDVSSSGQPVGAGAERASAGEGGRLLTLGVVLLAAVAGGAIFIESRMAKLEQAMTAAQEQSVERRQSDSDVLMGVDVKLDRVAQRADVEAAAAKTVELSAALELQQATLGQRLDTLQQDLAAVRRDLRLMGDQVVDYRPLFEDLRERHQRALAAIEATRELAAQPTVVVPGPDAGAPAVVKPVGDLPPELVELVQKLGATDPAVRFEAVDLLVETKNVKVLPHLLPLAKDPDAFVRRLTVEGLREFARPEAVEALLAALSDEDDNVRDTAWRSLRDVTGQKIAFEASAAKETRARAIQRWLDWWEKAKPNFGT